jgi:hypothetical protein
VNKLGPFAKGSSYYIHITIRMCSQGKLQIIFDIADDPALHEKYPLGVKVSHRAYAQDNVQLLRN